MSRMIENVSKFLPDHQGFCVIILTYLFILILITCIYFIDMIVNCNIQFVKTCYKNYFGQFDKKCFNRTIHRLLEINYFFYSSDKDLFEREFDIDVHTYKQSYMRSILSFISPPSHYRYRKTIYKILHKFKCLNTNFANFVHIKIPSCDWLNLSIPKPRLTIKF